MSKHRRVCACGIAAHNGLHHGVVLGVRKRQPAWRVELGSAKWREPAAQTDSRFEQKLIVGASIDHRMEGRVSFGISCFFVALRHLAHSSCGSQGATRYELPLRQSRSPCRPPALRQSDRDEVGPDRRARPGSQCHRRSSARLYARVDRSYPASPAGAKRDACSANC
jgi:hypothetical protein